MRRAATLSLSLWLSIGLSAACESRPSRSVEGESTARAAMVVELAGCGATRRDPATCVLPTGGEPLRLWVDARRAPVVLVDGLPVAADVAEVDGGFAVHVSVGGHARRLAVATDSGDIGWSIAIEPPIATPAVDGIRDALPADGTPGRTEAYERAVVELRGLDQDVVEGRLAAARLEMLLLVDLGRDADALAAGRAGLDHALAEGRSSQAIDLAHVLIHVAERLGDRAQVEWLLELQRIHLQHVVDGLPSLRFHLVRGRRALGQGDLRAASVDLEIALRSAERLGFPEDAIAASAWLAGLLGRTGRAAERDVLVEQALARVDGLGSEQACVMGMRLTDVAWALVSSSGEPPAATDRVFARALDIFAADGLCDPGRNPLFSRTVESLRVNHAYGALRRGDREALRERVAAIGEGPLSAGNSGWRDHMRATLAWLDGRDAEALVHVETLAPELERIGDTELAWRTSVLRGRLLERAGRPDHALAAYEAAEAWIDRAVGSIGFDQGREGLAAGMHEGASRAIELLLARGDSARAAAIARRSRSRALRPLGRGRVLSTLSPDARVRWRAEIEAVRGLSRAIEGDLDALWTLPSDRRAEILRGHGVLNEQMRVHLDAAQRILDTGAAASTTGSEPAEGELVLAFHPLAVGWVAFAITREHVSAARLVAIDPAADPAEIAATILQPFARQISGARVLRVLAMGPATAIPFHALRWQGAPLATVLDVVWGVDVSVEADVDELAAQAVVVGDPATRGAGLGRLAAAREEAQAAADRLGQGGWRVELLLGEEATHARLVAALAGSGLLHWAGHGRREGPEGWHSALPLAGEAQLDVTDILAASSVPRVAVLAGCDTGLGDTTLGAGGITLASAFVLAGSAVVVASYGEISDETALAYARELYRELPPASAEARLRWVTRPISALAALPSPPADWSRLRVLVP